MGRFSQLSSSQEVGSFDGQFSPSELRRAQGCVDSAVGLGGSGRCSVSSLLSCLGALFQLCGNGVSLCPSSSAAAPLSLPTIDPSLSHRAA